MKISPLFMAVLYFVMGFAFTFFAAQAATETIWNVTTILMSLIATANVAVAVRMISLHVKIKNANKK